MLVAAWESSTLINRACQHSLSTPRRGGEHAIGGGGLVVLLEQAADLEHVRAAEPVPRHGLRCVDLGSAAGDPVQSRELRSAGGRGEAVQIGGDRMLEVIEAKGVLGLSGSQVENLSRCRRSPCSRCRSSNASLVQPCPEPGLQVQERDS